MELTVKDIYKSYGADYVLEGVDLTVKSGEIHALLGENGAGKSTLMNILGGVRRQDAGQIFIDGKPVSLRSPAQARQHGIAFIHQTLDVINDLTVYEYIFLPDFLRKGLFLDVGAMAAKTEELLSKLGIMIDPYAKISTLDMPHKQLIAIAKAFFANASLIIMDEPTSSLASDEIDRVFAIMRRLRDDGVSMIFISHKLREVMSICDRYTVLRNGKMTATGNIADTTMAELSAAMVGKDSFSDAVHTVAPYGDTALELEKLSDGEHFFDVSLNVRRGEVLGITGLLGDGHSELFAAVSGIGGKKHTGIIKLDGKPVRPKNMRESLKLGIALLPDDRIENGILPDMSILDNGTISILDRLQNGLFIDKLRQKTVFARQAENLRIKSPDVGSLITKLSGGNQQKTVLAKWLSALPRVLILDNPMQGVDIGAKEDICLTIEELANQGMAIIVLTSNPQEIIRVCDRAAVMYHGKIAAMAEGDAMTAENLMYLATGAGIPKNAQGV